MSKFRKILTAIVLFLGGVMLICWGWYRHTYPYGYSHCCAKGLGIELRMYAEDHDGHFPSGMPTPEASLGLLYDGTNDYIINLLRGKTVPLKVTRAALESGKLGPESCGWHYVEGLTEADDPRIAIVWDKIGLGHNGQRQGGGHSVIFLDGSESSVSAGNWPAFLEEQKQLLANRDPHSVKGIPGLVATILLPTGQVLTNYVGPYEYNSTVHSDNSSSEGTRSGSNPTLRWHRYVPDNGQVTMTLTLPKEQLRSKTVKFEVTNGYASPSHIVFEMEKY